MVILFDYSYKILYYLYTSIIKYSWFDFKFNSFHLWFEIYRLFISFIFHLSICKLGLLPLGLKVFK